MNRINLQIYKKEVESLGFANATVTILVKDC